MVDDPYRFTGERQTGESWSARHQRMVEELPADGGTIIVVTNPIGRELKRAIRTIRGFRVSRRWRMIAVCYHGDCAKLEGLRGPVIVDWTVVAHAKADAQATLRRLVEQATAMLPPAETPTGG